MEPSQVLVSAGEFSGTGSESGWTRYFGSPHHSETNNEDNQSLDIQEYNIIHGYDDNHGHDEDGGHGGGGSGCGGSGCGGIADDEESDDSMASDASSGPTHFQFLYTKSEGSPGIQYLQPAEDNGKNNLKEKRGGKQVKETSNETKVEGEEEQELLLKAVSACSHV